ncbi:membrane-spanning 4-domains subfamily A member 4A-like [Lacerta agilis]|uniref:membrane-spanning 4-domains subfamily A member 4A-like n=1 Tax=Lacerta agilis TaxID=80427 RepID=UPI001419DCCD|nr:membrane-spanning 4-domains subfamily A member 4A-like [Lacerta agilis]XP_033013997.1 membrane-spanning 4-domains subfamily A member 4A-like [Lacerta agilis]
MDSTLIAPPWPSSRNESDANVPKSVKRFYRGEPLALGITQILLGITHIAFGVVINLTGENRGAYIAMEQPVWAGILYIISGSLSVAAARNPKVPMVKGMLGMNVVSSVVAGIGIVTLCFQMDYFSPRWEAEYFCRYEYSRNTTMSECIKAHILPWNMLHGIMAVFLVFNIVEFCITISTAAFGCKTVCQDNYTETVVVVYQNVTPGDAPAACKDPNSP